MPGGAVATLQRIAIQERLLDRVQLVSNGAVPRAVTMEAPSHATARDRHVVTRRPSSRTVQAPHWPWSQPFLAAVTLKCSRSASSSVVRVSTVNERCSTVDSQSDAGLHGSLPRLTANQPNAPVRGRFPLPRRLSSRIEKQQLERVRGRTVTGRAFPPCRAARYAAIALAVVAAAARKIRPLTGSTLIVRADRAVLTVAAATKVLASTSRMIDSVPSMPLELKISLRVGSNAAASVP